VLFLAPTVRLHVLFPLAHQSNSPHFLNRFCFRVNSFQYAFEIDNEPVDDDDDTLFNIDGNNDGDGRDDGNGGSGGNGGDGGSGGDDLVVVDSVSLPYLRGATLDFEEDMVKSAFAVVDNPNVEQGCGCGVSFAAKF
jgi:Fe-S cluster assembly iron-binding protein IscA